MWRAGGYLCPRCGCETDTTGRKVAADTPLPPVLARQWALLGVLLLVGSEMLQPFVLVIVDATALTRALAPISMKLFFMLAIAVRLWV